MAVRARLAGATGWAGSELARGIAASSDITLFTTVGQALATPCHVPVEYTRPDSA